jgi:hypothetical protein
MEFHNTLRKLPKEIKLLFSAFIITLNIGFFTGLNFVNETTNFQSRGIENNYLGNEEDEEAEVMQFKKSKKEILTLVHTHILSLSVIFLLLGGILSLTSINQKWKTFLICEPFFSLVFTFGGIYFLWSGVVWFKYIVMLSGLAMTATIILSSAIILRECQLSVNKKG